MEIDATCDTTSKDNGPNWNSIASAVLGGFSVIPGISEASTIAGSVIDLWAAAQEPEGFFEQWKKCIFGWINAQIDNSNYAQVVDLLLSMGTELTNIKALTDSDELSDYDYDQILYLLRKMSEKSDSIYAKAAGSVNPSAFLVLYDGALLSELSAVYLFIAKLQDIGFDPDKIIAVKSYFSSRMRNYKEYLAKMDNGILVAHKFWSTWEISRTYGGRCESQPPPFFYCAAPFHCEVTDSTYRTPNLDCDGCGGWPGCSWKSDCNADTCNSHYNKNRRLEKNAKKNMRQLLFDMTELVETAEKILAINLQFQLKGASGEEKVKIHLDGFEEEVDLTKEWKDFEYPRPFSGKFSLEILNDNRDVYIQGHQPQVSDLLPDFEQNSEWKCGTPNENERCGWLCKGKLNWTGKYTYTLSSIGFTIWTYSAPVKACISGFNDETHSDITLDECQRKCSSATSFNCKSLDFSWRLKTCWLSKETKETKPAYYQAPCSGDYYDLIYVQKEVPSLPNGKDCDSQCSGFEYGARCFHCRLQRYKLTTNALEEIASSCME